MSDFDTGVPQLYTYKRRPRAQWSPTREQEDYIESNKQAKQEPNKKAIQDLMNPSGDITDNPYDFGGNLGEM